jgi:hypothetical protein
MKERILFVAFQVGESHAPAVKNTRKPLAHFFIFLGSFE